MKLKVIKYHIYTYILDYYEHKDIKKIIENYEEKTPRRKEKCCKETNNILKLQIKLCLMKKKIK